MSGCCLVDCRRGNEIVAAKRTTVISRRQSHSKTRSTKTRTSAQPKRKDCFMPDWNGGSIPKRNDLLLLFTCSLEGKGFDSSIISFCLLIKLHELSTGNSDDLDGVYSLHLTLLLCTILRDRMLARGKEGTCITCLGKPSGELHLRFGNSPTLLCKRTLPGCFCISGPANAQLSRCVPASFMRNVGTKSLQTIGIGMGSFV